MEGISIDCMSFWILSSIVQWFSQYTYTPTWKKKILHPTTIITIHIYINIFSFGLYYKVCAYAYYQLLDQTHVKTSGLLAVGLGVQVCLVPANMELFTDLTYKSSKDVCSPDAWGLEPPRALKIGLFPEQAYLPKLGIEQKQGSFTRRGSNFLLHIHSLAITNIYKRGC